MEVEGVTLTREHGTQTAFITWCVINAAECFYEHDKFAAMKQIA